MGTYDLETLLILDEGERLRPYKDTVGKTTIGIGRNLTDKGITHEEALYLMRNDIAQCKAQLNKELLWFADLSPVRQAVLTDMCFNMGIGGLLGFRNTLSLVQRGEYTLAALSMLQSKWAVQVGDRAKRLSHMMSDNAWPEKK